MNGNQSHKSELDDSRPSVSTARDVLDTQGAANYLGVSRQFLEAARVSGNSPRWAKLSRLVRYRRSSLDEWLAENERSSTSEGK